MEYPQWIVIVISNSSTRKLVVKNVRLDWGKFHKDNNKDAEISIGDVEGKEVDAGQQYKINSCGRLSSPTGTEGGLDVYEVDGDKVCHLYWSCPWGGSRNEWRVSERSAEWTVDDSGANLDSGALGYITVKIYN